MKSYMLPLISWNLLPLITWSSQIKTINFHPSKYIFPRLPKTSQLKLYYIIGSRLGLKLGFYILGHFLKTLITTIVDLVNWPIKHFNQYYSMSFTYNTWVSTKTHLIMFLLVPVPDPHLGIQKAENRSKHWYSVLWAN